MSEISLGPWVTGLDNATEEGQAPEALREATNVLVSSEGFVSSRAGVVKAYNGSVHSLWSDRVGCYCMSGSMLCLVQESGNVITLDELYDMGSAEPVYYETANGVVYVSNTQRIVEVMHDGVAPIGPDDGSCACAAVDGGGLAAGRYAVAVTFLDQFGREGGASPRTIVTVPDNGGIAVSLPSGKTSRIYMSTRDGEILHKVMDTTDTSPILGGGMTFGHALRRVSKTLMKAGKYITHWHGRLLTARGKVLYYSEPLEHYVCDRISGFVPMPKEMTFIAATENALAVGQPDGTLIFQGDHPGNWVQRRKLSAIPIPESVGYVSGSEMNKELQVGSERVAIWLSQKGYTVMFPDGTILEPQADRLVIAPGADSGRTLVKDLRVTTVVR